MTRAKSSEPAAPGRPRPPSLLDAAERDQLAARRRRGNLFRNLTVVPVVLASALLVWLIASVALDAVTWQVVEVKNSGESFGLGEARSWEGVVRLELAAQGMSAGEIGGLLSDPEEVRRYRARNRVELMWRADGGSLRWVVSNSRDRVSETYDVFVGLREMDAIREGLADDERLYLNPWLDGSFLLRNNSGSPLLAGLVTALVGSLWVISLVILIAVPIGVGTAVYLEEYAPDNAFTRFIEVNLRNLAGVPSIVYGILGLYAFVRFLTPITGGPSVLSAALTLSLLILPVVVIAAREAIRAVPDSLRQASYGLGGTRWQTISRVVLPNAVSGIVTGMILSVARAIGETAPLLLVGGAGFITQLPRGPRSDFTVMPTQIYSWVGAPRQAFDHAAAAGIIALLIVLVLLYVVANVVRLRYERKW